MGAKLEVIRKNEEMIGEQLRRVEEEARRVTLQEKRSGEESESFEEEKQRLRKENQALREEMNEILARLRLSHPHLVVEKREPEPEVVSVKKEESPVEAKREKEEVKEKRDVKKKEPGQEREVDVSRLNLRVGKILEAKKHPDADSLYVETVDVAEEKPRTVVSGLVRFVPLEEIQGRMVVLMTNLKPAKMRGVTSEAMVMCASTPEKVEILLPPPGALPGDRVICEAYPGMDEVQKSGVHFKMLLSSR